jgi:DNA-binding transcriptional ArsR family regulator
MPLPSDSKEVDRIAASFRALAHPTRLRILDALRDFDRLSPSEVRRRAELKIALGTVSHHMRELRAHGLVAPAGTRAVRGALEHFYKLSPQGRRLLELIDDLVAHC